MVDVTENNHDSERDPLDLLIEQFLGLYRSGEPVTPEVFAEQHPDYSDKLLDLLPMLLQLEDVKRDRASSGTGHIRASLPKLDRLGDFRIEGELGRGGMGVVFEAVQESLDRRVALKVLPQASLLTGNQLERFRREAQIAARLHHTNIVPVYGSGESDGYHWYAMQHLSGQSLDEWRQTQSELVLEGSGQWRSRARFVARIGVAAASAVHYAHSLGTLHRDIKPSNLLLDRDDHLWVTDFGLAKALEAEGLTQSGDLLGTLQYMAPEQFAGAYDVRSEVYALGVTIYEMLTLAPAFRGRSRSELMDLVKLQRIELLQRAAPEVPLDLAIIVGKAMAREPGDRYPTVEALQHDLEAFLEDRPIQARPLSAVATIWRWCRRNRAAASLVASAAACVLLAAITGWVAYSIETDALKRVTASEEQTKDALDKVKISEALAKKEAIRAESNLLLNIDTLGGVFDALIGRDPSLSLDEDPETGEQTVVVHSPLTERDVVLLRKMMLVYDQFVDKNEESQSLRYEIARAYRRVGAIHLRLCEVGSLSEAEKAFEKALTGFSGVTDRDVRGDLASLHIDIAKLRVRQYQDARDSWQKALSLLESLPNSESDDVRLRRAEVLFEIARSKRFSSSGRSQGRGPSRSANGPGRSGPRTSELGKALQLLLGLLQANPDDHRVRALRARVLIEGGRSGADSRNLSKAVSILRELVVTHPDLYRYQFCETLLISARGSRRGLGGRIFGRPSASTDARLVVFKEAYQTAELLFAAQPLYLESRAMLLRAQAKYGFELHLSARRVEGDAATERVNLARQMLQEAISIGRGLVSADGVADNRFEHFLIEAHSWHGLFCHAQGQIEQATAEAVAAIEMHERTVTAKLMRLIEEQQARKANAVAGSASRRDDARGDVESRGNPKLSDPDGKRSRGPGRRGSDLGSEGNRPSGSRSRGERSPRDGQGRSRPPGDSRRPPRRPDDEHRRGGNWMRGAIIDLISRLENPELEARNQAVTAKIKELESKLQKGR